MTTRQKQGWALGVLAAILATIIATSTLGAGGVVWSSKADAASVAAYVGANEAWKAAHLAADSANWRRQMVRDSIAHELALDILCSEPIDPTNRKCRR